MVELHFFEKLFALVAFGFVAYSTAEPLVTKTASVAFASLF